MPTEACPVYRDSYRKEFDHTSISLKNLSHTLFSNEFKPKRKKFQYLEKHSTYTLVVRCQFSSAKGTDQSHLESQRKVVREPCI